MMKPQPNAIVRHVQYCSERMDDWEMNDEEILATMEYDEAVQDYYEKLPSYLYKESSYSEMMAHTDRDKAFELFDHRMDHQTAFENWHASMWSVRSWIRKVHTAKEDPESNDLLWAFVKRKR
jgi:hypothetical protein